jgi:hypothetical protein
VRYIVQSLIYFTLIITLDLNAQNLPVWPLAAIYFPNLILEYAHSEDSEVSATCLRIIYNVTDSTTSNFVKLLVSEWGSGLQPIQSALKWIQMHGITETGLILLLLSRLVQCKN